MPPTRFLDPLYGKLDFDPWLTSLLFAPEVQRLRYVRMCNINSLFLTGASEISRFEHVVGVLHLSREWTTRNGLRGTDARIVQAAALLHDLQTGPFGHSFEYVIEDKTHTEGFQHENVMYAAATKFQQHLTTNVSFAGAAFSVRKQLGDLWERVAAAIGGSGPYGALISGSVDLDNIDNVVRLAYHTGLADKSDADLCLTLARDLRLSDNGLSISRDGAAALIRWQQIRRDLYKHLLHDWAEFSAKAMLTLMMELGVEKGILGPDSWKLTDHELMARLTHRTVGEGQVIGEIGRRLQRGALYEPILLWRSASTSQYDSISRIEFKRSIEKMVTSVLRSQCIMHVILDRAKTERRVVMRMREDGELRSFGSDTGELLIGVFSSRPVTSDRGRAVANSVVREALANAGVGGISDLEDPLGSEAEPTAQPSLL